MPIYEFKCLECNSFFELLILGDDDTVEMKCPECHGETFERVLSTASFTIGSGGQSKKGVTSQSRSCSNGSCTTYTIPGPNG